MSSRRNDRIAIQIKELCAERKVTPYRVAVSIGREPSTLSDVIRGRRGMSDDLLVDLCDYFQCGVEKIIKILPPSSSALPP